ncbi:P-loop ATPase, Sll1717 family [Marinobacter sp.]|uniref:P-loop ATPase, Sll1717 family n=1 Tax=Marinobacter sp. TaxID=50741 RepID=UPI003A93C987
MDIKEWFPEFQVSAETDTELQSYFFQLPEVRQITGSRSWLVLGRKGMGKTAIYEHLKVSPSHSLDGFETICVNFRDYPWPAHQLYKDSLAGELSAYQKSWRYLFFVKAISKLVEIKEQNSEKLSKELKWAKEYIEKIYGNPDPSLTEVIFSKIARIKKIGGPGVDVEDLSFDVGEVSFDDVADDKNLQSKLRSNAFTLLGYFESIYKANCGSIKILIALDQLDENWLQGEIEEYSKVLINLVNTCRSISLDPQLSGHLKVVPFLRTDIYHSLRFNDKNKLLQDSAVVISWDTESLDNMFFERVKKFAPIEFGIDKDKKSGNLFEFTYARQGTPAIKYITRRSFFRPRDIIVYFNKIRDCHEKNKSGLYSSSELYEADRDASASVYNEIIDEWSNQFPEIESLLSVLQTIKVETFSYRDFTEKHAAEFSNVPEGDRRKHIEFLFDNSIVGQKKQGRWEYVCSAPNLKMNIEQEFRTHHALKYRLHLIESRPNQAV